MPKAIYSKSPQNIESKSPSLPQSHKPTDQNINRGNIEPLRPTEQSLTVSGVSHQNQGNNNNKPSFNNPMKGSDKGL